jgi:hypothetical protein
MLMWLNSGCNIATIAIKGQAFCSERFPFTITLLFVCISNKKPVTKVSEITEKDKEQGKKSATEADQPDRSDKEEYETEKADSSHNGSEQAQSGQDIDQQRTDKSHSEPEADENRGQQQQDQKEVDQNDKKEEGQDEKKDVSEHNERDLHENDQKKEEKKDVHENDQTNEGQDDQKDVHEQKDKQDDQKNVHESDQTEEEQDDKKSVDENGHKTEEQDDKKDTNKNNQERQQQDDQKGGSGNDQEKQEAQEEEKQDIQEDVHQTDHSNNQQDSQTTGPQDEQQDVKDDDQQGEPSKSADVPPKTGIDLSVEVTHKSVEEKEANPLIEILLQHDQAYRQDLKVKYKEQYGNDLLDEVRSSFSSPLDNALCGALQTPAEFNAWYLHKAVSGQVSAEKTLIEILGSKSNDDIKAVRTAYKIMYDKELEEDLTCNASGHFEKLLLDLQKGDRVENETVDQDLSEKEAKELYEAGEGMFGTDESTLIRILANRSRIQLVATFQEYEKVAGRSITESLERETSGVLLQGLNTLVSLTLDPWKFWADQVHGCLAIEETGKEAGVTSIVVGTQPKDLPSLKGRYLEVYGQSLTDAVKEKLGGDYGKLIVGLLGG